MQALMALFAIPLMLLNLLGGVVSGIWLAILGEWWAIGYGIVGLFASHFLLAIAMMPGMLFMAPAVSLMDKGKTLLSIPFVVFGNLYITGLITIWCLFIFWIFMSRVSYDSFLPLLIWSYGTALAPWMYMTQKEMQSGGSGGEIVSTFIAQISYITISIVTLFSSASILELGTIFGLIMIVGLVAQLGLAFGSLREHKRLESM